MSVETLISVEEYLNTSYDPDMEYVDGVLVERNVGDWLHSLVQAGRPAVQLLPQIEVRWRKAWCIAAG